MRLYLHIPFHTIMTFNGLLSFYVTFASGLLLYGGNEEGINLQRKTQVAAKREKTGENVVFQLKVF